MGSPDAPNDGHPLPATHLAKRPMAAAVDGPLRPLSQPHPTENHRNPHSEPLLNPSTFVESDGHDPPHLPYSPPPLLIDGGSEDELLQRSEFLTAEEVFRRRSRRLKQLSRYYRTQYWAMMEEVRRLYREYYWKYGRSPVEEEGDGGVRMANGGLVEETGETGRSAGVGFGEGNTNFGVRRKRENVVTEFYGCSFPGCKAKAMALTSYCHQHILSDSKQTLYKACTYVIKSAQTGQVICGKPVLRSAVPSLCPTHFQKAQRHVSQALKKAGLTTSSSTKYQIVKFRVELHASFLHWSLLAQLEKHLAALEAPMVKASDDLFLRPKAVCLKCQFASHV